MASDADDRFNQKVRQRLTANVQENLYEGSRTEEDGEKSSEEKQKKESQKPKSPYSIENFCWLIAAALVFYLTDICTVTLYDERIKRVWFNIGCLFILANIAIALFLIVYLSCIKKIYTDEWEKHFPAAIPLATASYAFGSFCVTVGLWPVWGFLTPVYLFTLFMGVVVLIAMMPAF